MSSPTVIGRVGHMEAGKYVTDEVTVQIEQDGWVGEGTGADEKKAAANALEHIKERQAESERRVAAAQEAKRMFIEEIRRG